MAVSHIKSNIVPDFTGTVTVFNSAGVTATTNATALVRPSDWNSVHNQFVTISGNTLNASTASGSNIIYQGAGNISLFATSDTLIFSGSQSVQTQGTVSVQGSQGAIVFSNSNNVTFGGNASTITASASFNQTVQTQGSVQVQGSTGAISFANGNGITFGGNASTITASHNGLTSQSNQAVSAANGSSAFQTLSFANGNGVTFATGVGGLGASVETSYAASNHSHGNPTLALTNLSGTTASNSAGLTLSLSAAAPGGGGGPAISAAGSSGSTGTIVFSNSNGVSFGMNGNTITATVQPGAAAGIAAVAAGTQQATSGTVTFVNSNGISFGMSGSSQITASYTVPSTAGLLSAVNISAGTTSNNLSALTFGNANGVTFGLNASTVTASHNGLTTARASNDAIGLNSAFTAGPLAMTINSSGLSLNAASAAGTTSGFTGGASISGSMTHNTAGLAISLSHPAWITTAMQSNAATISNINISAGTTSTNASAFTFNNANGITFGLGTGASAGSITASHNGLTTARASTDAIGLNTAQTNVTWTVNSSGISFNAAGYAGTATTFNGTNVSGSMTLNSAGLRLDLSAGAGGGGGGAAISAGLNSQSTGTVNFANSNGITFGLSNNGTMTASYNSTQFAGTGTTFAGANISGSLTQNSNGINMSLSVAPPGAAAENNAINLLGANTAGNTTATGSTIGWSGLNLTLSGTNASQVVISAPATSSLVGSNGISVSTNGNTISIYQPAGSYFANSPVLFNSQTQTVGQSTSVVFPIDPKEIEQPAFMRMAHTVSLASTSFASTGNTSYSYNQAETHNLVLYSRGTGASSQSLISIFSTSASVQMSIRLSRNTTNNISVTHALTFPNSAGTSSLSFSYAATNSSDQFSTTHMTALSGMKLWDSQFSTLLPGGLYWVAYGVSTTQTTQQTANLSAARLLHSHIAMSQPNNTLGQFGVANAASNQWQMGIGSFSTAGGGTTSAFPISAISSSSSHNVPFIQLQRIA